MNAKQNRLHAPYNSVAKKLNQRNRRSLRDFDTESLGASCTRYDLLIAEEQRLRTERRSRRKNIEQVCLAYLSNEHPAHDQAVAFLEEEIEKLYDAMKMKDLKIQHLREQIDMDEHEIDEFSRLLAMMCREKNDAVFPKEKEK